MDRLFASDKPINIGEAGIHTIVFFLGMNFCKADNKNREKKIWLFVMFGVLIYNEFKLKYCTATVHPCDPGAGYILS